MRKYTLILFLPLILALTGCPNTPLEQTAYRTIVAAKGFTESIKKNHPECATGIGSPACTGLRKAVSAKDSLIDAAEVYCSGPQFESGGTCQSPTDPTLKNAAAAKLQAAITAYKQTEADVKGAIH